MFNGNYLTFFFCFLSNRIPSSLGIVIFNLNATDLFSKTVLRELKEILFWLLIYPTFRSFPQFFLSNVLFTIYTI